MGNILIYGSCVARDAYEGLEHNGRLLGYIARQSLISAASKPTELLNGNVLKSGFQNRSLTGDMKSNLHTTVRRHAAETDILLIDLTDERLGVRALPDGSYVTDSAELHLSGAMDGIRARRIYFGTDEHFTLWRDAADAFANAVETAGLLDKALVLETPWADITEAGDTVPRYRDMPADDVSALYSRYHTYLSGLGFRTVKLPRELAIGAAGHKWGPAPYHYATPAYNWMRDQMRGHLEAMP